MSSSEPRISYSTCMSDDKACPSQDVSSFESNNTLSWFTRCVRHNVLKQPVDENLWQLDKEDRTAFLSNKFQRLVDNTFEKMKKHSDEVTGARKCNGTQEHFVLRLLWKAYGNDFLYMLLWKSINTLFTVSYPFIFCFLVGSIRLDRPAWVLNLYALGFLVVGVCDGLILKAVCLQMSKLQIHVRSTLMSVIYRKMLKLRDKTNCYTFEQMVALMTTDVNRLVDVLEYVAYFWLVPFHFSLCCYYIRNIYGFSVMICVIALFVLVLPVKRLVNSMEEVIEIKIQNKMLRRKFVEDFLNGLQVIRMYGWECNFLKKAKFLRNIEMKNLKNVGFKCVLILFIFDIIPSLMSSCCFGSYIYVNQQLIDVELAFVTLSIFNTLEIPLRHLANSIGDIVQGYNSMKRIDGFLNALELDPGIVCHNRSDKALIIENGNFSWIGSKNDPVLNDVNIGIPKEQLVSVVGPTGAGKSSFISVFLGELHKISGYINVNGKIAYVPQQGWIKNGTLKDNITLGDKIDIGTYKNALNFCALSQDLPTFPDGDMTDIGEKGIDLSDGQRQKINLARAVCRNADIYLIDDSLSAVDSRVSEYIFGKVIGPDGVLKGKTRVFVTSNVSFMEHSDLIVFLEDGCVEDIGTFGEIVSRSQRFSNFLSTLKKESDEKNLGEKYVNLSREEKIYVHQRPISENASYEEETDDVRKKGYLFLLKQAGVFVACMVLILICFYQVFYVCGRIWMNLWFSHSERESIIHLFIYFGFGLVATVISLAANVILCSEVFKATTSIYGRFVSSVLLQPWQLSSGFVKEVASRATTDVDFLDNVLSERSAIFLEIGSKFLVIFVATCYVVPFCVFIFVPVLILLFVVGKDYSILARQLEGLNASNQTPLSSYVRESVSGLRSICANNLEDKFTSCLNEKVDLCSSASVPWAENRRWFSLCVKVICGITVASVVFLAVMQRDVLTIGLLCFVISYAIQWNVEFEWLLMYIQKLDSAMTAITRIECAMNQTLEVETKLEKRDVPPDWPGVGEIRFENYELRYCEQSDLILKGATFSVRGGEKVAILGNTGSGKSSLFLGLLRMVEPAGGKIFIDGVDISGVDLGTLRSRVTVIPQDPILFLDTLRFNLDPNEQYTDASIWQALEKSRLKNFVQRLNGGLDYCVEEGDKNISGGQRQLLYLARALLRKTNIILLDVATGLIALESGELVQKVIRSEFTRCTVLTIAHRLNTLSNFDRILMLRDGRIVEFDETNVD